MFKVSLMLISVLAVVSTAFNAHAVVSETNGIYNLFVDDSYELWKYYGMYAVGTGADHPYPGENVLYGGADGQHMLSRLTVRSYTSRTDYVTIIANFSAFTIESLLDYSPVVSALSGGFRTSWTISNGDSLSVVQDTVIEGTDLEDSRVRITTTVTNNGGDPVVIGIRYMWDWKVDGSDDCTIKRHDPTDASFTSTFFEEAAPIFSYYEETGPRAPFSAFGTCTGPRTMVPPPTPPDLFYYCYYPDGNENSWTFNLSSGEYPYDSAVCYFWGDTEERAITLGNGESYSVTQYISTYEESMNPDPTPSVPTISGWGVALLALAAAGCGLHRLKRRRGR